MNKIEIEKMGNQQDIKIGQIWSNGAEENTFIISCYTVNGITMYGCVFFRDGCMYYYRSSLTVLEKELKEKGFFRIINPVTIKPEE